MGKLGVISVFRVSVDLRYLGSAILVADGLCVGGQYE
jgi:hypothetical protein